MNWLKRLWDWHMRDGGDEPWVPHVRWFYRRCRESWNPKVSYAETVTDVVMELYRAHAGLAGTPSWSWTGLGVWLARHPFATEGQAIREYRRMAGAIERFEAGVRRMGS